MCSVANLTLAKWFTNMSEEEAPLPNGGNGLLLATRTKSYGSLVRSPLSPVRQRRIEHNIQPGETLQGLALKYGVSVSISYFWNYSSTSISALLRNLFWAGILNIQYCDIMTPYVIVCNIFALNAMHLYYFYFYLGYCTCSWTVITY